MPKLIITTDSGRPIETFTTLPEEGASTIHQLATMGQLRRAWLDAEAEEDDPAEGQLMDGQRVGESLDAYMLRRTTLDVVRALNVMVKDATISAYLKQHDPMALRQATTALATWERRETNARLREYINQTADQQS